MKQSRLMSIVETCGGTALGFVVSLGIQYAICWWYALPLGNAQNLAIISVFTISSLLRGYVWRRFCEAIHVRRPLSAFMTAVVAERFRQIEQEGWSHHHDDEHDAGELALAGACYAQSAGMERSFDAMPKQWPWSAEWWKPAGFRRDLVKACALIVAEGEKFDRNRKPRAGAA